MRILSYFMVLYLVAKKWIYLTKCGKMVHIVAIILSLPIFFMLTIIFGLVAIFTKHLKAVFDMALDSITELWVDRNNGNDTIKWIAVKDVIKERFGKSNA